jgi:hypothetical protein
MRRMLRASKLVALTNANPIRFIRPRGHGALETPVGPEFGAVDVEGLRRSLGPTSHGNAQSPQAVSTGTLTAPGGRQQRRQPQGTVRAARVPFHRLAHNDPDHPRRLRAQQSGPLVQRCGKHLHESAMPRRPNGCSDRAHVPHPHPVQSRTSAPCQTACWRFTPGGRMVPAADSGDDSHSAVIASLHTAEARYQPCPQEPEPARLSASIRASWASSTAYSASSTAQ